MIYKNLKAAFKIKAAFFCSQGRIPLLRGMCSSNFPRTHPSREPLKQPVIRLIFKICDWRRERCRKIWEK